MRHFIEKWDCYLSILLGALLVASTRVESEGFRTFFLYYTYLMMCVVIFDTLKNLGDHESPFWKFAAILSNGVVLASCLLILEMLYQFALPISMAAMIPYAAMPNFLMFLGAFLIVENMMWTYAYDHF